jgi:hypothetical protein
VNPIYAVAEIRVELAVVAKFADQECDFRSADVISAAEKAISLSKCTEFGNREEALLVSTS